MHLDQRLRELADALGIPYTPSVPGAPSQVLPVAPVNVQTLSEGTR